MKDLPTNLEFDLNTPTIQRDIIRVILQYLSDNGYHSSHAILSDEAGMQSTMSGQLIELIETLRLNILEGEWQEVERLWAMIQKGLKLQNKHPILINDRLNSNNNNRSNSRVFGQLSNTTSNTTNNFKLSNFNLVSYLLVKHQFLELIECHEVQKAFTLLTKRIKPFEQLKLISKEEIRDLSYLLTENSLHELLSLKSWEGISKEREKLFEKISNLIQIDTLTEEPFNPFNPIPPNRLLTLIDQALCYQEQKNKKQAYSYSGKFKNNPTHSQQRLINSLLYDTKDLILPEHQHSLLIGHKQNIKSIKVLNTLPNWIATGSSDSIINIYDLEQPTEPNSILNSETLLPKLQLIGHKSRVWELASSPFELRIASASADSTIKIWELDDNNNNYKLNATLIGFKHDVYSIDWHPNESQKIISGGYDKMIRFYDILRPDQPLSRLGNHTLAVTSVRFSPLGHLVVSGSKDTSIQLHDIGSSITIKTLPKKYGEVSSINLSSSGLQLLVSTKDNSIRLWDLRMLTKSISRYQAHQNSTQHFIKSNFLDAHHILSGSEDGFVYVWDKEEANCVNRFFCGSNTVFDAVCTNDKDLIACGDRFNAVRWKD